MAITTIINTYQSARDLFSAGLPQIPSLIYSLLPQIPTLGSYIKAEHSLDTLSSIRIVREEDLSPAEKDFVAKTKKTSVPWLTRGRSDSSLLILDPKVIQALLQKHRYETGWFNNLEEQKDTVNFFRVCVFKDIKPLKKDEILSGALLGCNPHQSKPLRAVVLTAFRNDGPLSKLERYHSLCHDVMDKLLVSTTFFHHLPSIEFSQGYIQGVILGILLGLDAEQLEQKGCVVPFRQSTDSIVSMIEACFENSENIAKSPFLQSMESKGLSQWQKKASLLVLIEAALQNAPFVLAHILKNLCQKPEQQEALLEAANSAPSPEKIPEIFHETVRKGIWLQTAYPLLERPTNEMARKTATNLVIFVPSPTGIQSYEIPKDTLLYMDTQTLAQQEKVPTSDLSYLPFGKGPNSCPAQWLAQEILEVGLLSLVKNAKIAANLSAAKIGLQKPCDLTFDLKQNNF